MNRVVSIAKALADTSRLRVLVCLEGSTLCLCQITEVLGLATSTVSKHLSLLDEAGLVRWRQESRWRYYRWVEDSSSECVRDALAWVRRHALGTAEARGDRARREVVLQNSVIPCPREARTRVLFLCTGNSCRSQMAEAMLRAYSAGHFEVYSAGLEPKPIPEMTSEVMREIGMDTRDQKPSDVTEFLGRLHFGHLITVCANAEMRCPVFPGISHRHYWPIDDPAAVSGSRAERLEAFRKARDEIRGRIIEWLEEQGLQQQADDNGSNTEAGE